MESCFYTQIQPFGGNRVCPEPENTFEKQSPHCCLEGNDPENQSSTFHHVLWKHGYILNLKPIIFEEDIVDFVPTSNTGLHHHLEILGLQNVIKGFFPFSDTTVFEKHRVPSWLCNLLQLPIFGAKLSHPMILKSIIVSEAVGVEIPRNSLSVREIEADTALIHGLYHLGGNTMHSPHGFFSSWHVLTTSDSTISERTVKCWTFGIIYSYALCSMLLSVFTVPRFSEVLLALALMIFSSFSLLSLTFCQSGVIAFITTPFFPMWSVWSINLYLVGTTWEHVTADSSLSSVMHFPDRFDSRKRKERWKRTNYSRGVTT